MIIATTPRLVLRHFTIADAEQLAPILADPQVMRFSLAGPKTTEQTEQFIRWCLRDYQEQGFGIWAVINRADDQLIGTCGLAVQDIDGQAETEVGYRLAPSYWGRGLATEAAAASVQYAFTTLELPYVIALIEAANVASIRVAEKIGMEWVRDTQYYDIPVKLFKVHRASNDRSVE